MSGAFEAQPVFNPSLWAQMEAPVIIPPEPESISQCGRLSYSNLCTITSSDDATIVSKEQPTSRDPRNGAFTFKPNTEYDLLLHVQKELDGCNVSALSDVELANLILSSVDKYCLGKQWMFHVGHEKGEIVKDFLCKCIQSSLRRQQQEGQEQRPFVVVELGTYCGYSAILLAKAVKEFAPDLDFHVYSTEISEKNIQVATSMIRMAKLDGYVTIILLDPAAETLTGALRRHMPNGGEGGMDFLFLDHAKNLYLSDLRELERSSLVRRGTYVAADNVVFNRLDEYRNHVGQLAKRSIVETSMAEMNLEYSESTPEFKDGIELSIYLQDPPGSNAP